LLKGHQLFVWWVVFRSFFLRVSSETYLFAFECPT